MIQQAYSPHARKAWVAHFLQCQYDSYKHFLNSGLKESFRTFRTRLREDEWASELMFEFLPEFYKIKPPAMTLTQCLKRRRSWLGLIFIPLKIRWRPNYDTGLKPRVYVVWFALVQCPLMTRHGHFIVRGVPRVVLSQMVRRAGVYFRSKPDRRGRPKSSVVDIIAARGTWLRLEVKAKKRDMLNHKPFKTRISSGVRRLRHVYVHMPAQPNLPFFSFLRCLGLRPGRFHNWIRGVLREETKTWINYGGVALTSSKGQSQLFGAHIRYEVRLEDRDFLHLQLNPKKERHYYQRFVRVSDVKKVKPELLWLSDYAFYLGKKKDNPLFVNHPLWTRRWRRWSLFQTDADFEVSPALDGVYHSRALSQSSCFWAYDEIQGHTSQNWILRASKQAQPALFQRQNRHGVRPDMFLGEFPGVFEKLFPEAFQYPEYHSTYSDVITQELFGPMFYDLGRDGRKHMNEVLGLKTPAWVRTLTSQDILFSAYALLEAVSGNVAPETSTDHLQHKVLKPVGTLLQQVMLLGLIELKRNLTRRFKTYEKINPGIYSPEPEAGQETTSTATRTPVPGKEPGTDAAGSMPGAEAARLKLTHGWKRPRGATKHGRFPGRRKIKMLKHMLALPPCRSNLPTEKHDASWSPEADLHGSSLTYARASNGLSAALTPKQVEVLTSWQASHRLERYKHDAYSGQRHNLAAHEAYVNPNFVGGAAGQTDRAMYGHFARNGAKIQKGLLRLGPLYGLQQELRSIFHTVPFNKALRRFFGTNPLSQFLDETNAVSELTHKRRLSFMGLGGLDRYNATMDVRSIHPSHYGRICPIETPEGQNAGLVHSLTCFAHVNQSHLLTPFFPIYKTWVETRQVVKKRLDVDVSIVPGDVHMSRHRFQRLEPLPYRQGETPMSGPAEVASCHGVSQRQVLSLATSCIPFMEHNDGNRALMGSNMQRQAVALVMPQAPIVAAGMESKINAQSYSSKQARQGGLVVYVDASRVLVYGQNLKKQAYVFPSHLNDSIRPTNIGFKPYGKPGLGPLRAALQPALAGHQSPSLGPFKAGFGPLSGAKIAGVAVGALLKKPTFGFPSGRSQIERTLNRVFAMGTLRRRLTRCVNVYGKNASSGGFLAGAVRSGGQWHAAPATKQNVSNGTARANFAFYRPDASALETVAFRQVWHYGLGFKPMRLEANPFASEPCTLRALLFPWQAKENQPTVSLASGSEFPYPAASAPGKGPAASAPGKGPAASAPGKGPAASAGKGPETRAWQNTRALQTEKKLSNLQNISCTSFMGCNQHTYRLQRPCVAFGSAVRQGGFVASNASSAQGALSLGQNLTVGYTPWQGYNFEDAILMNQRLVVEDILTSLHIEHYDIHVKHLRPQKTEAQKKQTSFRLAIDSGGTEFASRRFKSTSGRHSSNGVLKPGSWVSEGDVFLFKWRYAPVEEQQKPFLRSLKMRPPLKDRSLTVPWQIYGRIIDVHLKAKPKVAVENLGQSSSKATEPTPAKKKESLPLSRAHRAGLIFTLGLRSVKLRWRTRWFKNLQASNVAWGGGFVRRKWQKRSLKSYVFTLGTRRLPHRANARPKGEKFKRHFLAGGSLTAQSTRRLARRGSRFAQRLERRGTAQDLTCVIAMCTGWFLGPKVKVQGGATGYKQYKRKAYARPLHGNEVLRFTLATPRRIQVGDKLSGRHGNKGIVSRALPPSSMPFCPDGTPLDLALNPLGVPSRMNVGQLYECLLGFAGAILKVHFVVPSFGASYGAQMSRSLSYTKLYEARLKTGQHWLFNPNFPGKVRCFDGRTGEAFLNPVTVGKPYILKLIHCVEEKLHARNVGPYNIVTQQPLRGRRRKGGQRVGEMEVWALEGFGAAYVLHELLNVKSDSMVGRFTVENHILTRKPLTWDNPESFKLLAHECQSLGFNIDLFHRNKYHKTKIQNQTYLF